MSDKNFVHLHVHTAYSLLDGISKREEIAKKAKQMGMPALAITDHGNMFNAISFYKTCHDVGIKPIIGTEFYVAPDTRFGRKYATKKDSLEEAENGDISYHAYHLTVVARNRQGYENLKRLNTLAYREGFYKKPRIDMEALAECKDGLIVMSGCLASMSSRLIVADQKDKAVELLNKQRALFGENFFLELMHHDIGHEEDIVNEALIDISKTHGIPLILTNDSHWTNKGDELAQETALCIGTNKQLNDPKHFKFNGEGYWFKSADEMYSMARVNDIPEEALTNTMLVNSMVEDYGFKLTSKKHPAQVPLFRNDDGVPISLDAAAQLLEIKAWTGLAERGLSERKVHQDRLMFELDMIKRKNFSSYFLIIADIIDNGMRKKGILAPVGRGSSMGSLVCYCLYVTGMDPVLHDIPFERFINEGRKDLPDIDTDISQERRKDVIDYIVKKYGDDRVAQIITFQALGAKAAIDNVGRALSVPAAVRRQVGKLIGDITKDDSVEEVIESNPRVKEIIDATPNWYQVSKRLEGNVRHTSAHAAGVVISNEPVEQYVPLIRDSDDGYRVTQYDMKDIAELGLLKLDMLGLKTMDLIQGTLELIEERCGIKLDYQSFPLEDAPTLRTIADGRYVSVFQYDSSGIRAAARQLYSQKFDHLVALNALYRPGPMLREGGKPSIMESYIERRHGRQQIETWHPLLDKIFETTYGLPIFQESIMNMTRVIAGFNEVEADEYRSAIGKKDKIKFEAAQKKFCERGMEKGHSQEFMNGLIAKLEGFARYAWNIGHSKAYSYISYVTAFLETHYPLEYFTTLLNVNLDDSDQLKILLAAILQKGVSIRPPHVNNSGEKFYTDGKVIYMGLYSVRQIGEKALHAIMTDRKANGHYKDFIDFCIRMADYSGPNKTVKENLIRAGSFSFDTSITNKDKFNNIELVQKIIKKYHDKGLPAELIREQVMSLMPVSGSNWTDQEALAHERAVLNFYISSHPVMQIQPLLGLFPDINFITPSQLAEQQPGTRIALVGLVESRDLKTTQRGDPYVRVKLGDQMGSIEVMIWSPTATHFYNKIGDQMLVILTGSVKEDKFRAGENTINVTGFMPLQNGMPISSFYAADVPTANQVLMTLGAEASTISDPIMSAGHVVMLKNVAFIRPQDFSHIRHCRVRYTLAGI